MTRNFENVQSTDNLSKINSDLYEIKGIIDKNLSKLMEREGTLEDIRSQASVLKANSQKVESADAQQR